MKNVIWCRLRRRVIAGALLWVLVCGSVWLERSERRLKTISSTTESRSAYTHLAGEVETPTSSSPRRRRRRREPLSSGRVAWDEAWSRAEENWLYAVVVDAGSTGCRVYVYQHVSSERIVSWKGPKTTPGLSSIAPSGVAEYIRPLVEFARSKVPESERKRTPFKVLATAGMRLMKISLARVMYDAVFAALPRDFATDRRDVRTISGEDEAYFEALAVNYAYGTIDSVGRASRRPLGALDLGGASTQIAVPLNRRPNERLTAADFGVASYLGYGVERVASRYHDFLKGADDPCAPAQHARVDTFDNCCDVVAAAIGISECRSERRANDGPSPSCALPVVDGGAKAHTTPTVAAMGAKAFADNMVDEADVLVATSLYYYAWLSLGSLLQRLNASAVLGGQAALDAALQDLNREWPSPSVGAARAAARVLCAVPVLELVRLATSHNDWEPAMGNAVRREREFPRRCFDLAYVDLLLTDVFGLSDSFRLEVAVDRNDVELDWTLGAVLDDATHRRTAVRTSLRLRRGRVVAFKKLRQYWRPLVFLAVCLVSVVAFLLGRGASPAKRRQRAACKKIDDNSATFSAATWCWNDEQRTTYWAEDAALLAEVPQRTTSADFGTPVPTAHVRSPGTASQQQKYCHRAISPPTVNSRSTSVTSSRLADAFDAQHTRNHSSSWPRFLHQATSTASS